MSGHSHAKTIKHQKNITDQKRGQVFSKMARVIYIAVKQGGTSPETNSKLRIALEQAKSFNMPKDNIERAIERAGGGGADEKLEEVIFEAYGPGGIAIMIEGITDNKNRTIGEIKQILAQNGGKLAGEGSVRWMFERKGCVTLQITNQHEFTNNDKEELELKAIEEGAEEIVWRDDAVEIYTKAEDLEKVKKGLEEKGLTIDSSSADWTPKEEVSLDEEKDKAACQRMFDGLDELDSVQNIYSNLRV